MNTKKPARHRAAEHSKSPGVESEEEEEEEGRSSAYKSAGKADIGHAELMETRRSRDQPATAAPHMWNETKQNKRKQNDDGRENSGEGEGRKDGTRFESDVGGEDGGVCFKIINNQL